MLLFATLGPTGNNHDWVANRHLEFHRLDDARVELFANFDATVNAMLH